MAEQLVPTRQTIISMADFARALLEVWPEATKQQAGVLWAHFAGETGDSRFCWNWNLGNVKHVKGDGHDYVALAGVWEGFPAGSAEHLIASGLWTADPSADHAKAVGPGRVSLIATKGNPATWFRAYPSLDAGMRAFVDAKRAPGRRYSGAWPFVLAGDHDGYARHLGAKGYYTASPDAYAAAMKRKFDAWMASSAFDEVAVEEDDAPSPAVLEQPIVPVAVVSAPDLPHPEAPLGQQLVPVVLDGVTWLVSPVYVAPVGIGEAKALAKTLGFELPSPDLVDAIWRAADLRVPPHLMIRRHDGVHMDTPELHAEQRRVLEGFIGGRSLGTDFRLLAGAFKDVVRLPDGRVGLYGWHADEGAAAKLKALGIATEPPQTPGEGRVVQDVFTGHALGWRDYSQGVRLVRRA